MTQTSLRAVTLKTVANYHHAAERAVAACRLGVHRLIVVMRRGVDSAARRSAQRFAPRLVAVIQHVGQRAGSLAAKGLDALSSRTSRAAAPGRSTGKTAAKAIAKVDAEVKTVSRRAATSVGKTARRVGDAANAADTAVKVPTPQATRKPAAKPSAQAIKAVKTARADMATATKPARRALKQAARPLVDAAKNVVETSAA